MAGATGIYTLDDTELKAILSRMEGAIKDLTPVMHPFGEYMLMRTEERFDAEETPEGVPWEPLSEITVARKRKRNKIDKILQQDGFLKLVNYEAGHDGLELGSNRIYAAIHQFGGEAGRNKSVTIPQREFLGFNDEDIKEFEETVKDFILLGSVS